MDKKPSSTRWRYWTRFHLPNLIYLLLLAALATASYWWVKQSNQATDTPEKYPELVDSFADSTTVNRTNKNGSVAFILTAQNTVHYGNQSAVIKQVDIIATPTGQTPMTTASAEGIWSEELNQIMLTSGVKMTRAADSESDALILTSNSIRINLHEGLASTDSPFKMTQGKSEITGSGFSYDYQLRNLTLNPQKSGRIKAILYNHNAEK